MLLKLLPESTLCYLILHPPPLSRGRVCKDAFTGRELVGLTFSISLTFSPAARLLGLEVAIVGVAAVQSGCVRRHPSPGTPAAAQGRRCDGAWQGHSAEESYSRTRRRYPQRQQALPSPPSQRATSPAGRGPRGLQASPPRAHQPSSPRSGWP